MIFHQIGGKAPKISFWNKISLILWIGFSLAILSFFTFTIFILALVVGIVIFTLGFFRRNTSTAQYTRTDKSTQFPNQNYRSKNFKNDDVIDI